MRIESKAPTRVDFAGATLDIWPLYLFHSGAVTLNTAISRYAHCVIDTQSGGGEGIRLVSLDTNRSEEFASFAELARTKRYRLPLLAEIVKFFHPEGGFTLTTNSEAPAGAGIGGSSAMAVLRRAGPVHGNGAQQSGLDSHQPRRGSHCDPNPDGHAGPLPAGIRGSGGD